MTAPIPLVIGYIAVVVNVASSVGIISFNKWLFQYYHWKWTLCLSWLHFCTTAACLHLMRMVGRLQVKSVPMMEVLKLASVCTASILFANLSLLANSMGVYQLGKMLSIPVVVAVESLFFGKQYARRILITLTAATVGISVAIGREVHLNMIGGLFAISSAVCVALCAILIGAKQREFDVDPKQLLYWQMLMNMVLGIPLTFIFDDILPSDIHSIWNYDISVPVIVLMFMSCLAAALLNISSFFILGVFSSVTYTVVGHGKTIVIIFIGWAAFKDSFDDVKFIGTVLVVVSIGFYAYFSHLEKQEASKGHGDVEEGDDDDPR